MHEDNDLLGVSVGDKLLYLSVLREGKDGEPSIEAAGCIRRIVRQFIGRGMGRTVADEKPFFVLDEPIYKFVVRHIESYCSKKQANTGRKYVLNTQAYKPRKGRGEGGKAKKR